MIFNGKIQNNTKCNYIFKTMRLNHLIWACLWKHTNCMFLLLLPLFCFSFFTITDAAVVVDAAAAAAIAARKAGLISFNGVRIFPTHRFNLDLTIFVIRVCWLWWRIMALLRNNVAFHLMAQSVNWRRKERHGCEKGNIGLSATRCILIDVL